MRTLPVIDISALHDMRSSEGIAEAAAALDAASRELGFFYAEGHGIPDALFDLDRPPVWVSPGGKYPLFSSKPGKTSRDRLAQAVPRTILTSLL